MQQLMTCLKTLMYSLSKFGNTTSVMAAPVPGGPPVSSFGMREEELRLASKAVVNCVPCLRIFCAPYRNVDREIGVYDLFAEMVSSLPVSILDQMPKTRKDGKRSFACLHFTISKDRLPLASKN